MSAQEFRDDDAGYLQWLATHRDGFVINIARNRRAVDARTHRAQCRTISGNNPRGGPWTGPYVKVCADTLAELEHWAAGEVIGETIRRCGICAAGEPQASVVSPEPSGPAEASVVASARFRIRGPEPGMAIVEAWADDYIRFEHRPAWEEQLRAEIRDRCRRLEPPDDYVLHASFFGSKRANADVENLALYNIDSFSIAGRNGIRFEHGANVPPGTDGAEFLFGYRYAISPRTGTFAAWRRGRVLASFDWVDMGTILGDKRAAQVWLNLVRGSANVSEVARTPGTRFAVKVEMRPPQGRRAVPGDLMKGTLDGTICAFQAHTDTAALPQVAERLSAMMPADATEIEARLLDVRRAVIGKSSRLVSTFREGVQWNPTDHDCVAGELLLAEPVDDRWAIKGEIVELLR
ncbi:hypothetical protein MPRF_04580 [Mycolicibacterium parafortuitum]|uniref:Uncharacterized protein n=1 Tax=Mycolicibacterium parafortuitum TaxID=39692 RepID=A0A7I7TYQ9_MYCPF|nr:hypothetical protein [Mycolicibacterium parafortuitum]BBY73559.1 hypothetical protein MPRF_04580 [Mycolicibacterium parafortuitum]